MDAKMIAESMFVTPTPTPTLLADQWKLRSKPQHSSTCVVAVLARPSDNIAGSVTYKDNWFDKLAINHLSKSVQAATGLSNSKSGYESLVEAAMVASQKFSPIQQKEVVLKALDTAFPKPILSFIRMVLPPSKLAREYFAVFTTLFFAWLVGPCEAFAHCGKFPTAASRRSLGLVSVPVWLIILSDQLLIIALVRESEVNGRREKNVVYIKKCRFLEESNCVGMCINLCKMPSQSFVKDSFGMPVNMVPNFDDMSCEMIFGQEPPASTADPTLKQPCNKLCKAKKNHGTNCLT